MPGTRTIRRRLLGITLLTSAAGIALTCAALIVNEFVSSRAQALGQMQTLARIIATNSTAALAFDDPADAEQVLSSLRSEPSIVSAALYDKEGRLFARYGRGGDGHAYPETVRAEAHGFREGDLEQIVAVREQRDQDLGFLYLRYDMVGIYAQLWRYVEIAGVIMVLALLASYLLANLLQLRIARPLNELVNSASAIAERGDFSVRAPPAREGEFKLLTDAFNQMLNRIDSQRAELLTSERRLRAALDSALTAVILMDADGLIIDWNPHAESIFGWQRSEVIGRKLSHTIIPERSREKHEQGLKCFLETGEGPLLNRTLELTALRRDGSEFPTETAIAVLHGQEPLSFCGFITDITERKQNRSRLQAQLARLDLLQRTTRAIGERQDLHSIFQVILRNLEDNLPIEFGCVALYDASSRQLTVKSVGARSTPRALRAGITPDTQLPIDNGVDRCLRGVLIHEPDIAGLGDPLMQRLANVGLRALVASPIMVEKEVFGVLVVAREQRNTFSSTDCEFLRHLSEHVALAAHQIRLYTDLQHAYDELRLSQQTILQQERLRALGQMASGVAHDINNAISPVALYTESLLEREPNLSERAREYLRIIQRAISDVGQTVARMREFYRQRDQQVELLPVDINALVQQALTLTRARWHDMPQERGIVIEVRTELADLPRILGIESDLRDALTNLIFNAVDAMPDGGTLTLRTRMTSAGMSAAVQNVELEVADTGFGMDEGTRRRCLEPFFTTKGERGSGLGLAMVYGMAERHNAQLEIDSAPGAGTTMRLRFVATTASAPESDVPRTQTLSRKLRLLVVDDDPLLSEALLRILEGEGHDVTVAEGGQQGIDYFTAAREEQRDFDLVMTDLGMPYVDGRAVAAAVKHLSSHTPVVLLTGWGQRLSTEQSVPEHVDVLLGKPPRLTELRQVLADLSAPSRAAVDS